VRVAPVDVASHPITYITLHYITLHYITLHYITLHYITLHYITLHYTGGIILLVQDGVRIAQPEFFHDTPPEADSPEAQALQESAKSIIASILSVRDPLE
jgi:hypothetical protein